MPHAGLDAEGRDRIDDHLRRAAEAGATVVLASHERDRAGNLAHRSVLIDGGRVFEHAGQDPDAVDPAPPVPGAEPTVVVSSGVPPC